MKDALTARIDLNLLGVFDAILIEGSLRGAAVRLGMKEAAVSQALKRLRTQVGDPLFERKGRGVVPTARAQDMARNVRPAFDMMRQAMAGSSVFEPQSVARTFMLDVPAGIEAITAPHLARTLRDAPGVRFNIASARASRLVNALRFGDSDIALDYEPMRVDGYSSELLYEDRFVVIARCRHPALSGGLDVCTYQRLSHVAVSWGNRPVNGGELANPLAERLSRAGIARNVQITVPSLHSMLRVVAETDMLGSTWARVAKRLMTEMPGLDVYPIPFELPPVPIYMVWHESYEPDPGHRWLRNCLRGIYLAL
jgi:DNA-binding transcriptional LysR family regulator